MAYSFTLIIHSYNRKTSLDDMRVLYSGNTCIVAKNDKNGGIYLHKSAKIVGGRFKYSAGSVRYPVLIPKGKSVRIEVTGFHGKPDIITDQDSGSCNIVVSDVVKT